MYIILSFLFIWNHEGGNHFMSRVILFKSIANGQVSNVPVVHNDQEPRLFPFWQVPRISSVPAQKYRRVSYRALPKQNEALALEALDWHTKRKKMRKR